MKTMYRSLWHLLIVQLFILLALLLPVIPVESEKYDFFFVVDITRSMNVRDYLDANGDPQSRLEKVKADLNQLLLQLPCGSTVGLGIFTERMPNLMFSPVEVCSNYLEIRDSIQHLDWRMAWVADSNIALAFYNTIRLMQRLDMQNTHLVFMTDGHEAPPINPRYAPDFSELMQNPERTVKGIIVGTGEHGLSRIPKFDEEGVQTGYYTAEDVPHQSSFGLPEDPSQIEGYVPRNAPWGNVRHDGNEHLSNVRDAYLTGLAEQSGFMYHHLQSTEAFSVALMQPDFASTAKRDTRFNHIPAAMALLLLLLLYPIEQIFRRAAKQIHKTSATQT